MSQSSLLFIAAAAAVISVLRARKECLEKFISKPKIYEPRARRRSRSRSASPPLNREDIPCTVVKHP